MSQRMEDLTGNIKRVCGGMAAEMAKRAVARLEDGWETDQQAQLMIEEACRSVLLDWFLGEFIPGQQP